MGTKNRVHFSAGAAVAALALVLTAGVGRADVTHERPGSIQILPKVICDPGQRETVIQISNTSNSLIHAQCYYVNGAPETPGDPAGPDNPALWQVTDFNIWLTRQQPTHWSVCRGRQVNPNSPLGSDGAGLDPGAIPPVVPGFTGELVCVQVDESGVAIAGNSLKSEATLLGPTGSVTKYNGIGILGDQGDLDGNNQLDLGNPAGGLEEYAACPRALEFIHVAEGEGDLVFQNPTRNRITLVPCTQNFEERSFPTVSVQVDSYNEFEERRSTDFPVNCYLDAFLDDELQLGDQAPIAFGSAASFGPTKHTILRPVPVCVGGAFEGQECDPEASICDTGVCEVGGLLGVLETTYNSGASLARVATNLHTEGEVPGAAITIAGEVEVRK